MLINFMIFLPCIIGIILQGIFIAVEHKQKYVAAVILKGCASIAFCVFGFIGFYNHLNHACISSLPKYVFLGLLFGALGDILLNLRFVFEKIGQKIFLAGIAAFLTGHILYLVALVPLSESLLVSIICGVVVAAVILTVIFKSFEVKPAFKIFGIVYIGAVVLMFVPKTVGETNRTNLSFKKKFMPYYLLIFFEGCRKQVFLTFAVYVLTKEFSTPLKVVATLMMINNLVNMFGYPIVGKMADKYGEKVILRTCYTLLIFVYIGYAYIKVPAILYLMYILDNVFYLSSLCLSSYVKKLCGPNELLTTLSTGQSFNHLAACIVPIVGGLIWDKFGYSWTFMASMAVVIISIFYVSVIPDNRNKI